jgi:hypothetical protein
MAQCVAVSPWGAPCVAPRGHSGDHVPGAVPAAEPIVHQSVGIAAYRAGGREAARMRMGVVEVPRPLVLVPTAAQRAAGVRLVDAEDSQMPTAARRLRDAIVAAGGSARATYAHALMPPKRGGEDWWDNHSVALRVVHADGRRGWGVWSNGKWDSGQWQGVNVGAREFAALAVPLVLDASLDSQARVLVGSAT